jgi:hypothetical protein
MEDQVFVVLVPIQIKAAVEVEALQLQELLLRVQELEVQEEQVHLLQTHLWVQVPHLMELQVQYLQQDILLVAEVEQVNLLQVLQVLVEEVLVEYQDVVHLVM